MKMIGVAILMLLLASCVSTKDTMEEIMSSWVGEDIDSVINRWGYPDETQEFNDREIYIWRLRKSVNLAERSTTTGSVDAYGNYQEQTKTTGGGAWHGVCVRKLEVNDDGTIVRWEWEGNNCPFSEIGPYKDWRNRAE